jgi:hypothetical protein
MADFSLTTLFVVPVGSTIPSSGSTQDLTPGKVGFYGTVSGTPYTALTSGNIASAPYFYVAQGRTNTYLQGSKRSDKIAGCPAGSGCKSNVTEYYKVSGCPTAVTQVTDVNGWNVKCGDIVTLTLRAHSSYIDTLYFNGLTRSVTVQAPCCACGSDPCTNTDVPSLIDAFILKLQQHSPGINPDNISLTKFFQFQRIGNDSNAILRITGNPLTVYGQPCDVAAFPYEYDRMYFRTFVYSGPATTADFIVADNCNIVATATITQRADYPKGTSDEIKQLEKNYYSYQAGYLKHLYRMVGYNENFESWVTDGTTYDTYYIKFNDYDRSADTWGDYIKEDSMVVIAVQQGSAAASSISGILNAGLGTVPDDSACITTTSTTTTVWPTTSTTTTLIP